MVLNCRSSAERPAVALNGLLADLTLQNPALRFLTPAFRLQTKPNRTDTHELPTNRPAVSVLVIIYNGSTAHLHLARNSILLNAAMQCVFGSAVRPPNLPADHSAEQPDHCEVNPSDYVAPSRRIAESLLPKFPVITSEIADEMLLDLPVQCLLSLSAGSQAVT